MLRRQGVGDTSTTAGYWGTFFGGGDEAPGGLCPDGLPPDLIDGVLQPCAAVGMLAPSAGWFSRNSSLVIGLGIGIFTLMLLRGGRR